MEVEDICYTAPTYFFNKFNQNIKLHVCKHVYQTLIKQKAPREIKARAKWKTTLMEDNIDWKYLYIQPIKLTNGIQLREYQFKLINLIVPNNAFLFKCKIASSSICDFCHSNPDSFQHVLGMSAHTTFWTAFTKFLNHSTQQKC